MAERIEAELLLSGVDISNDLIRKALEGDWDEFLLYSYKVLFPHYERKEVLKFQDQVNKIRYSRDKLASNLVGSKAKDSRKIPMSQQEFDFEEFEDSIIMGQ
jgi:hypothetical protein